MRKLINYSKLTFAAILLMSAAIGTGVIIACFTMANSGSTMPVCALMFLLPVPTLLLAEIGLSTIDSIEK